MAISIALSSLTDVYSVNVEGLGVIHIKKESSNQGLKTSENVRDIFKLQDEAKALQKKIEKLIKDGKTEEDVEIEKLNSKAVEKLDKISEIRKSEHDMRKARMSDDEGGSLVDKLYDLASDEDIARLFALADGRLEETQDGEAE